MTAGPVFAINPTLDVAALADRFGRDGRVQIDDFLAVGGAAKLRDELRCSARWRHVINGTEQVYEIAADDFEALDPAIRAQLDRATEAAAATGFQFRYDTIRVPDDLDERQRSLYLADAFARFMTAGETLDFLSRVTGSGDLRFVDAQATRYRPGDFLTRHDDAVEGKHRAHAYVLGLVEQWRPEWGGLLLFVGDDQRVNETYVPRFNTLSLFAVGQPHCVTPVAAYAPEPRLAVTGWLRTRQP